MMARLTALPCCLLLAGLFAASQAEAETQTVPGQQLALTDTLSEDLVISTDPALAGQVRISMDGSLSCLSIASGHEVVVGTAGCSEDAGRLRIEVSPDTPVTLTSNSDGDVHVGDLRAPLVASLNSSGDLVGGRMGAVVLSLHSGGDAALGTVNGPVTVEIAGSGDAHIRQINGPLTARLNGAGDLVAGGIAANLVAIDGNGSGDVLLGAGHIETLRARMLGSGDLSVAATIRDADVEARGSSDVVLAAVSGTFNRDATGSATIKLGSSGTIQHAIDRKLGRGGSGTSVGGTSVLTHGLMAAFLALVAYIAWRFIRRPRGGGQTMQASHPGIVALGETMARLDSRLAQLETYVTTREFDLNRKFREL